MMCKRGEHDAIVCSDALPAVQQRPAYVAFQLLCHSQHVYDNEARRVNESCAPCCSCCQAAPREPEPTLQEDLQDSRATERGQH